MKKTHGFILLLALAAFANPVRTLAQVGFTVSQTSVIEAFPSQSSGIAIGDLNGDGKADLLVLTRSVSGVNNVFVELGNGDGTLTPKGAFPTGAGSVGVVIADFNGDGKQDLAVSNANTNDVSLLLGNGDGTFKAPVSVPAGTPLSGIVTGDFNGDGKADLVVTAPDKNQVLVLIGNGNGTFKAPASFAAGQTPTFVVAGDLNGDGKLDLVTVNQFLNGGVSVLLGNGDGTFQAPQAIPSGGFPTSCTLADFNKDGALDLAVVDLSGLSVFLGKGDGTFQSPQHYAALPLWVVAGDVDGDGKLDLMVSESVTGTSNVNVFIGNGDGTFQSIGHLFGGNQPLAMAVGDFNKDGKTDFAIADQAAPAPGGATPAIYFAVMVNTTAPFVRTISHIADGAGFRTTFILLNTGDTPANFRLDIWSDTGGPLMLNLGADGVTASLTGVIPPHGARFIRTVGATPGLNKGWAQLIAPPAVDGNSIFGLQNAGQGDSEAAVPLSPGGGRDLSLPFDNTPGFVTGVAFADPGGLAATISGVFVDEAGTLVADPHTVNVAPHGHDAEVMGGPTFFPTTAGKRGAAHFSAGTNISGLGIRGNGKAFTTIEALSGVSALPKLIAHLASGGGWKTTFLLVNAGAVAAQFTLDFFSDAGSPLSLPLDGIGTVATLTDTIPPGGLRVVKATNTGALVTGWARLTVTGPISGTAIFGLETAGQADSEAAVPLVSQGGLHLFMPFDYSTGYSTGIAFADPNATAATVTVTFFDEAGNILSTAAPVHVPALGHVSKVLSELFPGIAGKRGTVSLTSDRAILALGIRADGFAFTSLKVAVP
jgi:hypothetical protein